MYKIHSSCLRARSRESVLWNLTVILLFQRVPETSRYLINLWCSDDHPSASGCRQTFTIPSALAVIISLSVGWCSVHVMTFWCTCGGGLGGNTLALWPSEIMACQKWMSLTSRRSQAQILPFSSPQITLASAWLKQARHRYEVLTCAVKSFSIFPDVLSISRIWESRVVTSTVCVSWVGTIEVTGSSQINHLSDISTKTPYGQWNPSEVRPYGGHMSGHDRRLNQS